MTYSILDPENLLSNGVFLEAVFLEKASQFNWEQYRGKQVLVRGCNSAIIPPWAFMYISGKLSAVAKSVRYGNEHDHIVVFRSSADNKDVNEAAKP
jgi:hypothetical protein